MSSIVPGSADLRRIDSPGARFALDAGAAPRGAPQEYEFDARIDDRMSCFAKVKLEGVGGAYIRTVARDL